MNIAIRYYSRSGNTKQIADAIGQALNVTAATTDAALPEAVDLLFIGTSIYAGQMDSHVRDFLQGLSKDQVKRVAVFGTAAGGKTAQEPIKALLSPKGIAVEDRFFQCKGKFLFANKGHPDEADCRQAAAFAKDLAKSE